MPVAAIVPIDRAGSHRHDARSERSLHLRARELDDAWRIRGEVAVPHPGWSHSNVRNAKPGQPLPAIRIRLEGAFADPFQLRASGEVRDPFELRRDLVLPADHQRDSRVSTDCQGADETAAPYMELRAGPSIHFQVPRGRCRRSAGSCPNAAASTWLIRRFFMVSVECNGRAATSGTGSTASAACARARRRVVDARPECVRCCPGSRSEKVFRPCQRAGRHPPTRRRTA